MRQTNVVEKKSEHTFYVQELFVCFENRVVYEIMWKNIVEPGDATHGNMVHSHCVLDT
jgi:hypothetical protein